MNLPDLQPGDGLTFSRSTLFDWFIRVKTYSPATHCEVYIGNGKTVASRNGKGVSIYDMNLDGLYSVRRPVKFDLGPAMGKFMDEWNGKPYGWLSLCSFVLIELPDNGLFCSELKTLFYRAGGFEPFNSRIAANVVAPADFCYISDDIMPLVWLAPEPTATGVK